MFNFFQRRTPANDVVIPMAPTAPSAPTAPTAPTTPTASPPRTRRQSEDTTARMVNHPVLVLPEVVPSLCPTVYLGAEEVWRIVREATTYNFHTYPQQAQFSPILNNWSMNEVVTYTIINMVNNFEHNTGLSCCHFTCRNDTGRLCHHIGVADRPNYIKFRITMYLVSSTRDKYSGILMVATIVHGGQPRDVSSYVMKHYIEIEPNSGYHFQPCYMLIKTTHNGIQEMIPANRTVLMELVPCRS